MVTTRFRYTKFADQIANGVAKVAEVLEQQIADTTLIDYSSLRSDFQDLLTDMDADSADFADNFEEYMRNAILNSMLKEDYMDRLIEWREKLYNAMDDGMTEDEYNALKAEGQQIANEMKAKRDALSEYMVLAKMMMKNVRHQRKDLLLCRKTLQIS